MSLVTDTQTVLLAILGSGNSGGVTQHVTSRYHYAVAARFLPQDTQESTSKL